MEHVCDMYMHVYMYDVHVILHVMDVTTCTWMYMKYDIYMHVTWHVHGCNINCLHVHDDVRGNYRPHRSRKGP
jgi:hypothetical protein